MYYGLRILVVNLKLNDSKKDDLTIKVTQFNMAKGSGYPGNFTTNRTKGQ